MARVLVEVFGQAVGSIVYSIPADAALKSTWELFYAEKTLRYSHGQIAYYSTT